MGDTSLFFVRLPLIFELASDSCKALVSGSDLRALCESALYGIWTTVRSQLVSRPSWDDGQVASRMKPGFGAYSVGKVEQR